MGEIHIIEQAVSAMKQQWGESGLNITYDLTPQSNPILKGRVNIIGIDFPCLVENEVNSINIGRIQDLIKGCAELQKIPILLIARYVQPGVYNILRTAGINFVDTVGNYQILYTKGKKLIFQLSHTGEKAPIALNKAYPIFQEAGLKVIFYLLQDVDNVGKTFREIKEQCDVSLGTIKNVLDELEARKFVLTTKKKRILKDKRRLLDLWVENYHHVLKPKLLVKHFAFRDEQSKAQWDKIVLPEGICWGGECAAYQVNGYLTPQKFEIYTDVAWGNLMKTGAMRATEGEITMYQKFWKGSTMPIILIYADLLGDGNSRSIEAANKILNDELSNFK